MDRRGSVRHRGSAVALLAGSLLLASCGSGGVGDRASSTSPRAGRGRIPFGLAGTVGGWAITVVYSTLEPPGATAHERVVPLGPVLDGRFRYTAELELVRAGAGSGSFWDDVSLTASGRSGTTYLANSGRACRDLGHEEPAGSSRHTVCFSIRPDDIDSLLMFARSRSKGPAPATIFFLQNTSH